MPESELSRQITPGRNFVIGICCYGLVNGRGDSENIQPYQEYLRSASIWADSEVGINNNTTITFLGGYISGSISEAEDARCYIQTTNILDGLPLRVETVSTKTIENVAFFILQNLNVFMDVINHANTSMFLICDEVRAKKVRNFATILTCRMIKFKFINCPEINVVPIQREDTNEHSTSKKQMISEAVDLVPAFFLRGYIDTKLSLMLLQIFLKQ